MSYLCPEIGIQKKKYWLPLIAVRDNPHHVITSNQHCQLQQRNIDLKYACIKHLIGPTLCSLNRNTITIKIKVRLCLEYVLLSGVMFCEVISSGVLSQIPNTHTHTHTEFLLCYLSRCCACIRASSSIMDDNCCSCNTAAIVKITGIKEQDIVYATYYNRVSTGVILLWLKFVMLLFCYTILHSVQ